jgi:hypothetical protein
MKRLLILVGALLSVISMTGRAQIDTASASIWRIYESLEYSDGTNNETWFVGDRELVHDIISKLLARGAVRDLQRNALHPEAQQQLTSLINQDYAEIMCVRRFDSEIQRLVLFSPYAPQVTDGIAPIADKVYLTEILGGELYEKLKSRGYPINGTSTRRHATQQQISFDLYLHLFDPHFMIWQDTQLIPDPSEMKDPNVPRPVRQRRWAVSLFGQLGSDYLSLPSWYKSSIIGGLKVSYVDDTQIAMKERDYEKLGIWVGYEESINFTVPETRSGTSNAFLKDRILQGSGAGVFARASWIPAYNTPDAGQYLKFALEGAVAITEKNGYGGGVPDSFYSVRNYLTLRGSLKHLLGIFDVGAGLSWHDLHSLRQVPAPITRLEPTSNNWIPFVEVGISQDGSLLQYAISTQLNYNLHGYSFFVVKSQLVLSNWFGVDIRYFTGFGMLPAWHYDNYIQLSPIIRINY